MSFPAARRFRNAKLKLCLHAITTRTDWSPCYQTLQTFSLGFTIGWPALQ